MRPLSPRSRLTLLLAALAAVVTGGCAHVEAANAQVANAIRDRLLSPDSTLDAKDVLSVSCENKTPKAGVRMVCTVKVGDAKNPQTAEVDAIYSTEDAFNLEAKQAVVSTKKLASSLVTGNVTAADCGSTKVVVVKVGDTIDCTTTFANGSTGKVTEKVADDLTIAPVTAPTGPEAGSTTTTAPATPESTTTTAPASTTSSSTP